MRSISLVAPLEGFPQSKSQPGKVLLAIDLVEMEM